MEKHELSLFIDACNSDEGTKQVFYFLVDNLSDIKDDLKGLNIKVDDLQHITIINGGGSKLPTTMRANDFHQMTYNKSVKNEAGINELRLTKHDKMTMKSSIKNISWWFDSLFKIAVVIAFLLYFLGAPHASNAINSLPVK
jgi:hypothetical protein